VDTGCTPTIIAHCLDLSHSGPFEWYTKLPKGQHRLEIKVYDYAGNKAIQTVDVLKFL